MKKRPTSAIRVFLAGLLLLVALMTARSEAQITIHDGNQTFATLTGSTVTMTGNSQLYITGSGTPMSGCVIHLNSEDAWLFLTNVRPSSVNTSTYLNQIKVSGATAVLNTNCRIVMYGDGTVVIPQASTFAPMQVFTGPLFTGTSMSLNQYTTYDSTTLGGFNDNIASFKLKRGYMATVAQSSSGTGKSKCYVAADGDLEVSLLTSDFSDRISFVRVFPWRWVNKKGVGGNITSGLNVRWWYDWNLDKNSTLDEEYVAIRQNQYWPGLSQDWKARGINHLLGYNEPDNSIEAGMSVSTAIGAWPDLLNTGLRVGSPATTDGSRSSWLYPFVWAADSAGLRVDFVAAHYYWCASPSSPSAAASQMYNFLKDIYNNTGRPIWVTEWNQGANWTGCGDPTSSQHKASIQAMIDMLDSTPFVERYAIYNWVEDVRRVKWDDGSLTSSGVAYRDQVSPLGYTQEAPYLPTPGAPLYRFENDTRDSSGNGHFAVPHGKLTYTAGHTGLALTMSGVAANEDYVTLPSKLGDSTDFTFGAWVYWNGGADFQRIFDLGHYTDSYMYLTPSSSAGGVRFGIYDGSTQQQLNSSSALPVNTWTHVAVTISGNTGKLFVNGAVVATNNGMTLNPSAVDTKFNYLGKSQWSTDPLFAGKLDDAQFLPYALSDDNVARMMANTPPQFSGATVVGAPATQGVAYNSSIASACSDPDVGDTLTFSKFSGPSWLVVGSDGTLTGTPGFDDEGAEEFVIRAVDSAGAAASVVLMITLPPVSGNGTWTSLAGGSWDEPANWSGGFPANGAGYAANFNTLNITQDMTVSLDRSRKIGALSFADTSPSHSWTLSTGTGSTLTFVPASGATPVSVTSGTATLDVGIAGSGGFTKTGAGTLVLTGDNTLTGTMTLGGANANTDNDGTVRIANPDAISGISSIKILNNTSSNASSILELDGAARNISSSAPITLSGRNAAVPAIRNLSGNNTLSGALTIEVGGSYYIFENNSGALNLNSITSTASNNRLLTFRGDGDFSFSGAITNGSATMALLKSGSGTLTLNGANTWSGTTTINGGTVTLGGSSSLGTGASALTIATGATLNCYPAITFAQTVSGGGSIHTANTTTVTGNFSGFSGNFTHNSKTSSVAFNSATATSGSAAYVLASTQGSLQGMIAGGNGNYTLQLGSLSGIKNSLFRGGLSATGATTLQIGSLNTDTIFDGIIANGTSKTIALTKVGGGALTLGGTNTYTGATTVSQGTLVVNGTTGNSDTTVSSGATLGGGGTVRNNLTAQSGATIRTGGNGFPLVGDHPFTLIDDFQDYPVGQIGTTPNSTGNVWTGVQNGTKNAEIVADAGNKAMSVHGLASASGWRGAITDLQNNFASDFSLPNGQTGTWFFRARRRGTANIDAIICIGDKAATTSTTPGNDIDSPWDEYAVTLSFSGDSTACSLRAYDDGDGDVDIRAADTDEWINVWVTVDNAAKTFRVATSSGTDDGADSGRAYDFGRRTAATVGSHPLVSFGIHENNSVNAEIDDLYFMTGASLVNPLGAPLVPASETLTVQNNFTLSPGATLVMDLSDPGLHDRLLVGGQFGASGTLRVVRSSGSPAPAAGDTFDLFDSAGGTINFASYDLPALTPGLKWDTGAIGGGVLSVAIDSTVYAGWALGYSFPPGADAPSLDPDHDGIANAFEWLFGTDPLVADAGALPQGALISGGSFPGGDPAKHYLAITATVRKSIPGMTLVPQAAASLELLGSPGSSADIVSSVINDLGDFEERRWVHTVPVDASNRGFMRLKMVEE